MAWDTVTARTEPRSPPAPPADAGRPAPATPSAALFPRPVRRHLSTLTLRILAPNLLPLVVLAGGLLFLDQYRASLIDQKVAALQAQAVAIAGTLAETALGGPPEAQQIQRERAGQLLARLLENSGARARLFAAAGDLIADSRYLAGASRQVQLYYLPAHDPFHLIDRFVERLYDWLAPRLPRAPERLPYVERPDQRAEDYEEVAQALAGTPSGAVRGLPDGSLVLTVAVPVQHLRQVLGGLLLSSGSAHIEEAVRSVRVQMSGVIAVAFGLTVLLSLFLAGTIARPIRRLARMAERAGRFPGRPVAVPNLRHRHDEIGDLSVALDAMVRALNARIAATERFAADVAHEIRNPLTSLKSASETLALTRDPARIARLRDIIAQDIERMDRLIGDISNASRIEAEMLRAEFEPVDLLELANTVAELHRSRELAGGPRLQVSARPGDDCRALGLPGRLGQALGNLVDNALSFSPPGGMVTIRCLRDGGEVVVTVEDDGPGLPQAELERVFERFYSRRPQGEAFGRHSGLGLSIVRQVADMHGGRATASNRLAADGQVLGACFRLALPQAEG
ncbi:MAG: HAMP domain-containing protein [Alphaproteobacteria bacterium]|nr:HAMP domain-containing protein [Alphaproteobacteria bacterium]